MGIDKMKKKDALWIIKSEYDLLHHSLERELLKFNDDDNHLTLSPFIKSISSNIKCLKEYVWIVDAQSVERLKQSQNGELMLGEKFIHGDKQFALAIRKDSSD